MALVKIVFTCGHRRMYEHLPDAEVACAICGNRRVASVSAPPPKVRATACAATSPLLVKE